jgi:hypothetical protein
MEACDTHWEMENILFKKPLGKSPHAWPRCRWEDKIIVDHTETGCEGVEWIQLAKDRVRGAILRTQ